MTAGRLTADKVYDYGEPNPKISEIEERLARQEQKIRGIEEEIKRTPAKKQTELNLARVSESNKLVALRDELVEAKFEMVEKKNRYYVPDK